MQTISPSLNPGLRRFPRLSFGLTWLIILPGLVWGILDYFLPLLGGTLPPSSVWIVTVGILLFTAFSLAFHVLAHAWVARLSGQTMPASLTLLASGDAAQRWPEVPAGARELLVAVAGPLVNLVLAEIGRAHV